MEIRKIDLNEKLTLFNDYWNPKIVGELNGQHIKLVKMKGEFVWHKHIQEDEMFFVINGNLKIELRDRVIELGNNEFIIIPKGTEHKPYADEEVSVMLIEPINTINTGYIKDQLTRNQIESI